MKNLKPKNDINYILKRLQDVEKTYNILILEFAIATIEKKLTKESKILFFKRWDKIAMNCNHWHQVGNISKMRLVNPFKIKYLDLRKIYNKSKTVNDG